MILNIFDFDDTLFRTQNFAIANTKGKTMYEWYDSKESLSPDFNIVGIENIIIKAQQLDSMNFIITHRLVSCKNEIYRLINQYDIVVEDIFFLGRKSKKSNIVNDIIKQNSNITVINIYEDSLTELIYYSKELILYNQEYYFTNILVNFIFVDKTRIINMPFEVLSQFNTKLTPITLI